MSDALPLSNRALKRLGLPPPHAYLPPPGPFYDPELYPDGIINLSIAENSLLSARLIEHLSRPLNSLRPQHLRYRATLIKTDLPTVEDLLPEYINDHFNPRIRVTRENSVAGPGIGACLAQLCLLVHLLPLNSACVPPCACEITALLRSVQATFLSGLGPRTKLYATDDYVRDITHPSGATLVMADVPASINSLSPDVLPILDARLRASAQGLGIQITALLIPNPHNPLPQVVQREVIEGYARLAEKYNIHLIVDEVYALSTYDSAYPPEINEPFESVLTYDLPALGVDPSRVHVLAGPTKDFGASGLKLGLLISPHNIPLMNLIRPLFNATPISSLSDVAFARVLQDKPFVEKFLADNRALLRESYEITAEWLMWHGLEFTRANAAVYVVVNFEPFLARIAPKNADAIEKLDAGVAALIRQRVFIKPTNLMADPVPTRFRLIFSQPRETLLLALRRIERAFDAPQAPLPTSAAVCAKAKASLNGAKVVVNGWGHVNGHGVNGNEVKRNGNGVVNGHGDASLKYLDDSD
uniref:PLP-dependent transferase n=1 Tax=Mycena chlorophos TaxID=658473 RepID=A0ABQ0M2G5_MYCCL|nr:PLP-dependent transferase [Mycena chlorophos]